MIGFFYDDYGGEYHCWLQVSLAAYVKHCPQETQTKGIKVLHKYVRCMSNFAEKANPIRHIDFPFPVQINQSQIPKSFLCQQYNQPVHSWTQGIKGCSLKWPTAPHHIFSISCRNWVPRHSPIRASPIGKRLLTSAYLTLAYQDLCLSMALPVFVTFAYHVHWPIRQVPIRLFMSLTKVLYWQFRHPEGL